MHVAKRVWRALVDPNSVQAFTPPGWYPAPNGEPVQWYWTGIAWIDPVNEVERRITEVIAPQLERLFIAGMAAGAANKVPQQQDSE